MQLRSCARCKFQARGKAAGVCGTSGARDVEVRIKLYWRLSRGDVSAMEMCEVGWEKGREDLNKVGDIGIFMVKD